MMRRRRLLLSGLLLAFIYVIWAVPFMLESAVVAIDGQRYFGMFDDAMISMRYAWNFSHGQGLVWNPGERIEGYSNLLWTLVMSALTFLLDKVSAVLAVQILGVVIVLACALMTWMLAMRAGVDLPAGESLALAAAAVAITLTYYPLTHFTLTGMETGLLTLLIAAALCAMEGFARKRDDRSLLTMALLLGLAYLTREDSAIFSIPIFAYVLTLPNPNADLRGRVRLLLPALGLFLLFPIGREVFRLLYYGDILPNTYYLKMTGMPLAVRLQSGLGFTSLYLVTHIILLGVCIGGCVLKPDRRKLLYLVLVTLPILYQIWVGGDPVRMWRMMTPAVPAAAVLFGQASLEIIRRMGRSLHLPSGRRMLGYLTALAILAANLIFIPFITFQQEWFPLGFYRVRINAAAALNELTTGDASVAVLAAGVVPYYTDLRAHDMLGRTDAYIASLPADISGAVGWGGMLSVPGHNKYDLEYSVKQLRPTYVEASTWGGQDITAWMEQHYERAVYKGVELWLLKDSPYVRWELLDP
jgi:hypothetical protein